MKMVAHDDINKMLLAALVGSVVTLLVSPFTQTLSFILNEYLARPILSIEYAEIITEEQRLLLPATEIQGLIDSECYRTSLMRGFATETGLMVFQGRKDATSTELQSLKASTMRFLSNTESRLSDLMAFLKVLSSGPTEAQVREITAKYRGPMAQFYSVGQDVKSEGSSLLAAIEVENKFLGEAINLGKTLLKSLERIDAGQVGKIKLKLNILNRGNTDGLIRHVGELTVPSATLTLQIRRSSPPEKPSAESLLAMAVPVSVTNPQIDLERTTSVGKVEKHSMSEFWFDVDDSAMSQATLAAIRGLVSNGKLGELAVILFDHQNKRIVHRFSPPQKSKNGDEAIETANKSLQ